MLIFFVYLKLPYVGLHLIPVHNSLFSLNPFPKSEFFSNDIHQKPSTPCPETQKTIGAISEKGNSEPNA
jgi:hypothetical protein